MENTEIQKHMTFHYLILKFLLLVFYIFKLLKAEIMAETTYFSKIFSPVTLLL